MAIGRAATPQWLAGVYAYCMITRRYGSRLNKFGVSDLASCTPLSKIMNDEGEEEGGTDITEKERNCYDVDDRSMERETETETRDDKSNRAREGHVVMWQGEHDDNEMNVSCARCVCDKADGSDYPAGEVHPAKWGAFCETSMDRLEMTVLCREVEQWG